MYKTINISIKVYKNTSPQKGSVANQKKKTTTKTSNTISSTRSPDLIVLFTGTTENAAVLSPEIIPSSWYLCV